MWLIGFLSNAGGMLVGGIIAWLFKKLHQKVNNIYAVCSGLILGLISIEILPDAIDLGGTVISFIGLLIGILTFDYIHKSVHRGEQLKFDMKEKMYDRTGLIVMLSLSIHNLPMGIILGASHNEELTETVLLTLFFHSIPEGIILFIPLVWGSIKIFSWLLISFFISIPVIIGVLIGSFIGFEYNVILALIVSFTAGNLLMVIIKELLFVAFKKSSVFSITLLCLIGFGIICIYLKVV